MALFTDGPINTPAELEDHESAILDVAHSEGIDVSAKIRLAQEEIANRIVLFLLSGAGETNRRVVGMSDVAVTQPLQQWHAHKTLALVYRDAYNRQLNDRYQGKWKEYERLAKASAETFFRIGVGLIADPVPRAGLPVLGTTPGASAGATFYVAITWVNAAGSEGSPSEVAPLTANAGERLTVQAGNAPTAAAGWNVYAGGSPESISRQNMAPIPVGSGWTLEGSPATGAAPGNGQPAGWFISEQQVIQRG